VTENGSADVQILKLEGDDESGWRAGGITDFQATPFMEVTATFSPDGRWLAYASDEAGKVQVFVRPFQREGGKRLVSVDGRSSFLPLWLATDHRLLFAHRLGAHPGGEHQVLTSEYADDNGSFRLGDITAWPGGTFFQRLNFKSYDVHPDGKRLLLRELAEGEMEPVLDQVVLFEGFTEHLRKKTTTGKEMKR
jgi:hypothetical protein